MAEPNGIRGNWPFDPGQAGGTVRYYIEIRRENNGYAGQVHRGGDRVFQIKDLKLACEDTVLIKNQSIRLDELVRSIITFEKKWLENRFDERGQYETGVWLFHQLFGGTPPWQIQPKNGHVEIRIVASDEHICRLPWVLLAHRGIFLSASGWSVALSDGGPETDCELPPSPKIIVAAPEPSDFNTTGAQKHIGDLRAMLESSDSAYTGDTRFRTVVTWDDLKSAVKSFQPDIFYYYGHGTGNEDASKLVFADTGNKSDKRSVADLGQVVQNIPGGPPLLAYVNCCLGDAGGFLGAGTQLGNHIPAVLTNRTYAYVKAAKAQGLHFLKSIVQKGMTPHEAAARLMRDIPETDLSVSDSGWMTPVLHCRYGRWISNPPKPSARFDRDPHWRVKLDRVAQFSQVFLQVYEMFQERKPGGFAYLWYGTKGQGVELFHQRLKVDLREKLPNVVMIEITPKWPPALDDPLECFTVMLNQAFGVTNFDQIPAVIRTRTRSVSGKQTLVYIRHRPVTNAYIFHPENLKVYLDWFNHYFVGKLPERTHALLGISYVVSNPSKFQRLLTQKERLNHLEFSDTVFQILNEMDKIVKEDLIRFIQTHNIPIPDDLRDRELDRILDKTGGMYEKVLDELIELESRVWRERRKGEEKGEGEKGEDEWGDVF